MKISTEEVSRLLSVPAQGRAASPASASHVPGRGVMGREAAQVDVSTTAQEIHRVKKLLSQVPDVRAERVAELKKQVENGTYYVSGDDIADLMIRRTLADNTAL